METKEPKNPDYKVRRGRMMMDHAQPRRADLFTEAPGTKKGSRGRAHGLALRRRKI
jgi:hypothetical protein